ncbi:MAG: hypothetical protein M0D53_11075 [Flavobacterium sp. JAD_PAG50586_2]|nr:MAG: hypothetical protein M0D53_11075 [Flavobacterium sp. JAD_PAG50586_2]
MKNIFLIAILTININLYSQTKVDDYKRLVDSTIVIKSIETYNHFQSELSKNIKTDNWKYYIDNYKHSIENIYLLDSNNHPYSIGLQKDINVKFKLIDIYNKKNIKLLKKGIDTWKIIPNLENNKLIVTIINFKVIYYKNEYKFVNGGGTTIIFEYQCNEKKWTLVSNKSTAP